MTPELALLHIVRPGLRLVAEVAAKPAMASQAAEVMLLAIGLQESGLRHRHQINGPAHGWWQFERDGGLRGVLRHKSTAAYAGALLEELDLPTDVEGAFEVLPWSELAQVGLARLLLWTDPRPLPIVGMQAGAWDTYLRNWRPGKPRSSAWPANYAMALELAT